MCLVHSLAVAPLDFARKGGTLEAVYSSFQTDSARLVCACGVRLRGLRLGPAPVPR